MATQKLYAGVKLRELRQRLALTQKDFAAKLGVSLPYLNQMENNNRPISSTVTLEVSRALESLPSDNTARRSDRAKISSKSWEMTTIAAPDWARSMRDL